MVKEELGCIRNMIKKLEEFPPESQGRILDFVNSWRQEEAEKPAAESEPFLPVNKELREEPEFNESFDPQDFEGDSL